jgi:hypothetical protein
MLERRAAKLAMGKNINRKVPLGICCDTPDLL